MTMANWPAGDCIQIQVCTGKNDTSAKSDAKKEAWIPQSHISMPPFTNAVLQFTIMKLGSTEYLFPNVAEDRDGFRYGFKVDDPSQFPTVVLGTDQLSICVTDTNNDGRKHRYWLKLVPASSEGSPILVSGGSDDPIYVDPAIQNRSY